MLEVAYLLSDGIAPETE